MGATSVSTARTLGDLSEEVSIVGGDFTAHVSTGPCSQEPTVCIELIFKASFSILTCCCDDAKQFNYYFD